MLRILIVPASDWVLGPKQYLHDIAERLGKKHTVFVWHFNLFKNKKPCIQKVENVQLIHPWSIHSETLLIYYAANFIPHSLLFARIVRKLKIDVVIALNLIPALWSFSLAPSKTLKVFGFQDYYPESASVYYENLPRTFRRILESSALLVNKLSIKLADLTLCPCFSLINLSQKMGCKKNYFLPNGADTVFFNPSKSDEKMREKLGLSEHTLVFHGLIENWVDFDTILAGLKILKKKIPDVKLLIAGSTLTGYTKTLKKKLQDTNLTNDVVLTGYVPDELIPYYLNLGTMCIMPYKVDTFSGKIRLPLKLFVYSAMGKPILSVPLPEVRRLDPKHVFYYQDEMEFAQQAYVIFNDQKLQRNLANYARTFSRDFEYSILAEGCESILQENTRTRKL